MAVGVESVRKMSILIDSQIMSIPIPIPIPSVVFGLKAKSLEIYEN